MAWIISEPAQDIFLQAEEDGLWLRSNNVDLSNSDNLTPFITAKTRLGRFLPTLIPQLLELGLAVTEELDIKITYDDFINFEAQGIDAFDSIIPWAPFLIDLKSSGIPGRHNFTYELRFFWGRQQVYLERLGCFVRRNQQVMRLDKQSYALIEKVKKFNELPPDKKELPDAFIRFADIRGLSEGIGASIDSFIHNFRIIVTPVIGLDFIVENDKRISFVPKIDIEGIRQESIHKVFLQSSDPTDLGLQASDGKWVKIVFNEEQKEVLRRMQKVRKFGGKDRADVLRNPQKVFDGVAGAIDIGQKIFGERVKGIGDFPFISQPFVQYANTGIFDDPDIDTENKIAAKNLNVGIKCIYPDGGEENVMFKSRNELLSFQNTIRVALQKGEGTVELNGKIFVVDRELANSIDAVAERVTRKPKDREQPEKTQRLYLLIYENEDAREYVENRESASIPEAVLSLPESLKDISVLKNHQLDGVRWLQHNYLLRRGGCLLADDMGLGKTLQVLTFIAWLIEQGDISQDRSRMEEAPWNPVLIIAPVMLLENETWIGDMNNFFRNEGTIFTPFITLHGDKLKSYRKAGSAGTETNIGEAVLDIEKLRAYRVIFTNYETVVNYQFSFAMMKSGWSVVVTDEAQEYKTSSTKISHALKSLSPTFRIACTGTPVETKLIDIWNIFDFLQPGSLLGSAREFNDEFVRPFENHPKESLNSLRKRLHFGEKSAYLLRRDKTSELEGLPDKKEHKLPCDLSSEQRDMHIDLIKRGRIGGEGNHPLSLIQRLMHLYQHPALISHDESFPQGILNEAFERCPKLEKLIEVLQDIKSKEEKVLVFTRSLKMQEFLATAIHATLGINAGIVNGATPRKGSTRTSINTRKEVIRRFKESNGFNVIILSPEVAGIGLTLIEANHVIHYGRWWNPAKESQATDRVYRIGQSKDVHVYYLIARDPQNKFKTFDEKLDALIERRRQMAADFLLPMSSEEEMGKELYENIFDEDISQQTERTILHDDVRKLTWDRFEALVALIEEKQGRKSILTPRSGDLGIDVISVEGNKLRLIQCKHTLWNSQIDADVIAEMINGFDNYRSSLLRDIAAQYTMTPVLITNGGCSRSAIQNAGANGVQIVSGHNFRNIIENHVCTFAELENRESRRVASVLEVKKWLMCI